MLSARPQFDASKQFTNLLIILPGVGWHSSSTEFSCPEGKEFEAHWMMLQEKTLNKSKSLRRKWVQSNHNFRLHQDLTKRLDFQVAVNRASRYSTFNGLSVTRLGDF